LLLEFRRREEGLRLKLIGAVRKKSFALIFPEGSIGPIISIILIFPGGREKRVKAQTDQ